MEGVVLLLYTKKQNDEEGSKESSIVTAEIKMGAAHQRQHPINQFKNITVFKNPYCKNYI